MKQSIAILFSFFLLASCGNQADTKNDMELKNIEDAYFAHPSPETYNLLMHKYQDRLEKVGSDKVKAKPLLLNALRASETERMVKEIMMFQKALISDYPKDPNTKALVLQLAQDYEKIPKTAGATILYAGLMRKYVKSVEAKKSWEKIPPDFIGIEAYLDTIYAAIFNAPDGKTDESSAVAYLDAVESLIMVLPDHNNVGDYILEGGRISSLIGQYDKAIWFYDWMADDYSKDPKAPIALFEKALVFKNKMEESYNAKNTFIAYIRNYPKADSVIVAKAYLNEMGWTE